MITKIQSIKNLAVFNDFNWDDEVKDAKGEVKKFTKINIIYGRNYSGKTTLSRIIRSLETGTFSDKYENPDFCLQLDGVAENLTLDTISENKKTVRVFNEDFVTENLNFISNPDENIKSFAVLGENVNIEKEIEVLKNKLGVNTEGQKSGLYKDFAHSSEVLEKATDCWSKAENNLEVQIKDKALDKKKRN